MPLSIRKITDCMEEMAPKSLAESWDNVGLMVGDFENKVDRVLAALDISDDVIDEAIEKGCGMIITHHPMIFKAIKNINTDSVTGRRIIKLIKNDIAVFSAHTNLDIAGGGTNDTFAELLGLKNTENLCEAENEAGLGLGKVGELENEISFAELIGNVKKIINTEKIIVSGSRERRIKKVGIGTGSCCKYEYLERAKKKGCDAYISADFGYHEAQCAVDLDLCIIDATHYGSEVLIVPKICEFLQSRLNGEIEALQSEVNGQTFEIV